MAGAATLSAAGAALGGGLEPPADGPFAADQLMAGISTYARAGNKAAGGPGDEKVASWLSARLASAGFEVSRQEFEVPWFSSARADLAVGNVVIPLIPQPLVQQTPLEGLLAPLKLAEIAGDLTGTIALVRLAYRRWSSLLDPAARKPVADAMARGALAAIVITTGPTGQALLLNTPADKPLFDRPVALLAPADSAKVVEAARTGAQVRLTMLGTGGHRLASNLVARIQRGPLPWLVVSTPRSGWTDCVGERGPGVAIWLALAAWAAANRPNHNLLFVCNSGHEYENLGASHLVAQVGPPPAETAFWLHLGANAATRDWHELPGRLLPLPSADPFRYLVTSPGIVPVARQIFAGQPGIEMAYSSDEGAAGELSEVIKAGYPRLAGIFGAHRFHHAPGDDLQTIAAAPLSHTARACRDLVAAMTLSN